MKHRWEHVTSCIAMFVMHRLLTIVRHLVHKVGHMKRIVKSGFEAKHRYKISSCKIRRNRTTNNDCTSYCRSVRGHAPPRLHDAITIFIRHRTKVSVRTDSRRHSDLIGRLRLWRKHRRMGRSKAPDVTSDKTSGDHHDEVQSCIPSLRLMLWTGCTSKRRKCMGTSPANQIDQEVDDILEVEGDLDVRVLARSPRIRRASIPDAATRGWEDSPE